MILVDANLLIYAVNRDAPRHERARLWLETALTGTETVAFSWGVLLAFLRLTTRAGLFRNPLPVEAAFEIVEAWVNAPPATILEPGVRHLRLVCDLILPFGTAGNLTSDAHLAALAVEHGATLCTTDGDFARFPRLRWRNPLT